MMYEYIDKQTLEKECSSLKDERLDELYQEIRSKDRDFFVREYHWKRRRFNWRNPFRPVEEEWTEYEILHSFGWQAHIITFFVEQQSSFRSAGLMQDGMLEAYMKGYLNGLRKNGKKEEEK